MTKVHVFGPDSSADYVNATVQALYADQDLYMDRRAAIWVQ